jgi:hypothetical protein
MFNLDKLNSKIDLKNLDFKNLDLKNLDLAKITKLVSEHQNSFIKLVLIVGTLFLTVVMYNDHRVKDQDLSSKTLLLKQKFEAIKARDQAVADLSNFKSSVPEKLSEYDLITLMSSYAKKCNVAITTLSPADSVDMGLYDIVNVNFNVVSDNFKDLMLFLRMIEKSKFPLRINKWSGREDQSGRITFITEVSAVLIHI